MIKEDRILVWLAMQFTIGVTGATFLMFGPPLGSAAFVFTLLFSGGALLLGRKFRDREGALKKEADAIALVGLMAFLLVLILTKKLIPGLGVLLFFAQLALFLLLREHRQLYFCLAIGFIFVLGGSAEAKSGWYLAVFLFYGMSTSLCLSEMWGDGQKAAARIDIRAPLGERLGVAAAVVGLAALFYLILPQPPATNLGERPADSPDFYSNQRWEQDALNEVDDFDGDGKSDSEDPANQPNEGDGQGPGDGSGGEGDRRAEERGGSTNRGEGYNYPGFESSFDIEEAGQSQDRNSNQVVAYMKAPRTSYIKVRTFDQFDGLSWSQSNRRLRKRRVNFGEIILDSNPDANFRQVFEIEKTMPPWLPVVAQPVHLWLPASVIAVDKWEHPVLPSPLQAGTTYRVDSHFEMIASRQVGGSVPPDQDDLQLHAGMDPRIAELAQRITGGYKGDLAKASALENHLRNEYAYSFESIFESQGVTPLPKFLFEEKVGHCEYFASAMAVMLRSLGIPARLVTGFSVRRKNPMTGYYEIRALDGHAWVEAWVNDHWLTFEPTAFYDMPDEDASGINAQEINDYVESLLRDEAALGGEWDISQVLPQLWRALYAVVVLIVGYIKLILVSIWPILAAVGLPGLLLFFTRDRWLPSMLVRLRHRQIRQFNGAQSREALNYYLWRLQYIGAHYHVRRQPAEDIQSWARRLERRFGQREIWRGLADQVERVYYLEEDVPEEQLRAQCLAAADCMCSR